MGRGRVPRAGVVLAVLLVVVVVVSVVCRARYGEWVPGGQPPPRLTECGRRYERPGEVVLRTPPAEQLRAQVGSYPPLVGAPIRAAAGCGDVVPTGVYLQHDDGWVGYGLLGGP